MKDFTGTQEYIEYVDSDYASDLDKHRYNGMCLHCPKHQPAGAVLYSLLSHCLI